MECSEHLSDKAGFIRRSAGLLRDGGVLALCAWLAAEPTSSAASPECVARICQAMLLPSLGTMSDYLRWMRDGGLLLVRADDLTSRVEKTWRVCRSIVGRPVVRAALPLCGARTRRFVGQFPAMAHAYRDGALRYGMFVARRP